MSSRLQQDRRGIAPEAVIGALHITEGICDMPAFGIEIHVTTGGIRRRGIGVVNDMNDVQWRVQGASEFAREHQRGPAGWVAVVSDN